jgi:acyl-CoA dehydrogenase
MRKRFLPFVFPCHRPLNFEESDEQRLMREVISETVSKFDDSYWRSHDHSAEFPQEYFDALAKNGWFNINVPKEYGGTGLGLSEVSIAIHEASRRCGMAAGDIIMAICTFGIQNLKSFAKEALKTRLLPELGAGKHIFSFALTEPLAVVDTLAISTRAEKEGDGYVLNGHKIWITLAHKATLMAVVARTTERGKASKRTQGLSIFLVECGKLGEGEMKMSRIDDISMRALGSNEVHFENLHVPAENLIGRLDEAWEILPSLLNAERISTASMSIGLGELVLEKASNYAKARHVFSRPIGANQAIQFPLARSLADLRSSWAVTQKAAWEFDNNLDCSVAANVAAYMGARSAFFAADRAMQTYGGMAYSSDSDVERHWRDARLFRTGPVPEEMVLNLLGQRVLNLPRSY